MTPVLPMMYGLHSSVNSDGHSPLSESASIIDANKESGVCDSGNGSCFRGGDACFAEVPEDGDSGLGFCMSGTFIH